jgi:hypothetical protein
MDIEKQWHNPAGVREKAMDKRGLYWAAAD